MEIGVTQNLLQTYNIDLKNNYFFFYKMTFTVGHNNKCHIYRSVDGSAIYIL